MTRFIVCAEGPVFSARRLCFSGRRGSSYSPAGRVSNRSMIHYKSLEAARGREDRFKCQVPKCVGKAYTSADFSPRVWRGGGSEAADNCLNAVILGPFAAAQGKLREGPRQFPVNRVNYRGFSPKVRAQSDSDRAARDEQGAGAAISAELKPRPSGSSLKPSQRGEKPRGHEMPSPVSTRAS